jgi:hypothetical protein
MVHDPEILDSINLTDSEKLEAETTNKEVGQLLERIQSSETEVRRNFAQLGTLLLRMRTRKYWFALGYPTFGSYIDAIKGKVGKGRTQLYSVIGVADKLLPYVDADELAEIGITKATLLKQSMKQTGKAPTDEALEAAQNPNVDAQELKALLFKNENGNPETEQGKYWDWGGSYLTADEKDEVTRAFECAKKVDPVISQELPDHVQRKEIMLRLCREFLATYEALVAKGQG